MNSSCSCSDIRDGKLGSREAQKAYRISAKGYYVKQFSSYFNNAGDDVLFLKPDGTPVDVFSYANAVTDKSWARIPDGGSWAATQRITPTSGAANQ